MKKILSTTLTKVTISAIGLIITLINSRVLGASGLGTISLIVLTISIILIFNEIVAGGALVYLIPRYSALQILVPSYAWSIINIGLFYILLKIIPIINNIYHQHVLVLALILSFSSVNSMYLLGKQKVGNYNLVIFLQFFVQITALTFYYFVIHEKTVLSMIYALYTAYISAFIVGIILVIKNTESYKLKNLWSAVPSMFKMGFFAQIGNISQMLNYRFSYYLIEKFLGTYALGRYTIGIQLSESAWLISRSTALVHYSEVANSKNTTESVKLTIRYARLLYMISFLVMIIIVCIPSFFYEAILGKDFINIQPIMVFLLPGIVILSSCQVLATFFSGTGKIYINTYGSIIGLVVTVISALILIPHVGIYGAAISASLSYLATSVYTCYMFLKQTNCKLHDFIIKKEDFHFLINKFKELIKK